jgi:hypothetical protein
MPNKIRVVAAKAPKGMVKKHNGPKPTRRGDTAKKAEAKSPIGISQKDFFVLKKNNLFIVEKPPHFVRPSGEFIKPFHGERAKRVESVANH